MCVTLYEYIMVRDTCRVRSPNFGGKVTTPQRTFNLIPEKKLDTGQTSIQVQARKLVTFAPIFRKKRKKLRMVGRTWCRANVARNRFVFFFFQNVKIGAIVEIKFFFFFFKRRRYYRIIIR